MMSMRCVLWQAFKPPGNGQQDNASKASKHCDRLHPIKGFCSEHHEGQYVYPCKRRVGSSRGFGWCHAGQRKADIPQIIKAQEQIVFSYLCHTVVIVCDNVSSVAVIQEPCVKNIFLACATCELLLEVAYG